MTIIATDTEQQAKDARRFYINQGARVSLIGFNTESDMFEFDVYDS